MMNKMCDRPTFPDTYDYNNYDPREAYKPFLSRHPVKRDADLVQFGIVKEQRWHVPK